MRLDKHLSLAMVGTRKNVKKHIYDGLVTVNSLVCKQPWTEISDTDEIHFNGNILQNTKKVYYLFNKPCGCLTMKNQPHSETVFDYFTDVNTTPLFAVGRLDKETQGLLIITNDGELCSFLSHPDSHLPKTYYFIARGNLSPKYIAELSAGTTLYDDTVIRPSVFSQINNGFYPTFSKEISEYNYSINSRNPANEPICSGFVTITQGQKHQVRKMLKHAHCTIFVLKRTAIGNIQLPNNLELGQYKQVTLDQLGCNIHQEIK